MKKSIAAVAVVFATAVGGEHGSERAVSVQAEQQGKQNRQAATAKRVRAENAVFRAQHKQRDKDPKGQVTLSATSHKKPPVFRRRGM